MLRRPTFHLAQNLTEMLPERVRNGSLQDDGLAVITGSRVPIRYHYRMMREVKFFVANQQVVELTIRNYIEL